MFKSSVTDNKISTTVVACNSIQDNLLVNNEIYAVLVSVAKVQAINGNEIIFEAPLPKSAFAFLFLYLAAAAAASLLLYRFNTGRFVRCG